MCHEALIPASRTGYFRKRYTTHRRKLRHLGYLLCVSYPASKARFIGLFTIETVRLKPSVSFAKTVASSLPGGQLFSA